MNINDAFPSNFLKASDLGDGQPVVTIDRVEVEPIGRDREMKPVVYFAGKQKGLVLNKTNSKKIAEIASSPDTDDWAGVAVKIYATETEFGGETVECIRIKAPKPVTTARQVARQQPPPPPQELPAIDIHDDDIPF